MLNNKITLIPEKVTVEPETYIVPLSRTEYLLFLGILGRLTAPDKQILLNAIDPATDVSVLSELYYRMGEVVPADVEQYALMKAGIDIRVTK